MTDFKLRVKEVEWEEIAPRVSRMAEWHPPNEGNGWTAIITLNGEEYMRFLYNRDTKSYTDESGNPVDTTRLFLNLAWASKKGPKLTQ